MYNESQVKQLEASLNQIGEEEVPKGLIQANDGGVMVTVVEYLEKNSIPPTVDAIRAAVKAHEAAGHKLYHEPFVMVYANELQQLSPEAQKKFNTFWNSTWVTGQLVTGSSQQGYDNATKFLVWMHGREMSNDYLQMAFSNLTAKGQLHFIPSTHKLSEVAQKAEAEKTHKPGVFFEDSRIKEREWQRAEARRKADAEAARGNTTPSDAVWKEKWDRLQGNSYAQTSRVRAIWISRPDGSPDYKAMYEAGLALLDESGKQPLDRY